MATSKTLRAPCSRLKVISASLTRPSLTCLTLYSSRPLPPQEVRSRLRCSKRSSKLIWPWSSLNWSWLRTVTSLSLRNSVTSRTRCKLSQPDRISLRDFSQTVKMGFMKKKTPQLMPLTPTTNASQPLPPLGPTSLSPRLSSKLRSSS